MLDYVLLAEYQSCPSHRNARQEIEPWKTIGEVHRRYTRMVNYWENREGNLWHGKNLVIESGCLWRAQSSKTDMVKKPEIIGGVVFC